MRNLAVCPFRQSQVSADKDASAFAKVRKGRARRAQPLLNTRRAWQMCEDRLYLTLDHGARLTVPTPLEIRSVENRQNIMLRIFFVDDSSKALVCTLTLPAVW